MKKRVVRAQYSSTAAAQNSQIISSELWPQQARAELSWLQDLGSL